MIFIFITLPLFEKSNEYMRKANSVNKNSNHIRSDDEFESKKQKILDSNNSDKMLNLNQNGIISKSVSYENVGPLMSIHGAGRRYLIVDDSELNRKVLKRLILSIDSNCVIDEADDGSTAIEQFKCSVSINIQYNCVFLDYIMTTMHGPTTAQILREELGYTGLMIGVTGNALADDIDKFIKCGLNCILTKPVRREQLSAWLDKF